MADANWKLRSNSGWHLVSCHLRERLIRGDGVVYLTRITAYGHFWDRRALPNFDTQAPDLEQDHVVVLPQFMIQRQHLERLAAHFSAWLDEPAPFEVDLGTDDQRLVITIGKSSTLISSDETPVATVRLFSSRFSGEFAYAIDQSCVRMARNEIKAWLRVCA